MFQEKEEKEDSSALRIVQMQKIRLEEYTQKNKNDS